MTDAANLTPEQLDAIEQAIGARRHQRAIEQFERVSLPQEGTPAYDKMQADAKALAERRATAAAAAEAERAEAEARDRAQARRSAENAPKIAALEAKLAPLLDRRRKVEAHYIREVAPIERSISDIRRQIAALR